MNFIDEEIKKTRDNGKIERNTGIYEDEIKSKG